MRFFMGKNLRLVSRLETKVGPDSFTDNYGRHVKPIILKVVPILFDIHTDSPPTLETHEKICNDSPDEADAYMILPAPDQLLASVKYNPRGHPSHILYLKLDEKK